MKKIIPILILTFLIFSCHQKQPDKTIDNLAGIEDAFFIPESKQASNAPLTSVNEIEKPQMAESKIIKDGRLGLRVKELEKTKRRVDTLVIKFNGYYANESLNNTDWESSYSLKVRIPGTNFENFISEIEAGDGEILYKEINARDVTDQFIDLETRLDNKRNYLKRYNDLLVKAKTVKEILEIEEKIRGLEEEIESTTGRLKYLSNLVDFSTLDLTISRQKDFKYKPLMRDRFSERFKQSLSKGWFGFVDFLLLVIKIWPFWLIVVVILFFWKKNKRPEKRSN